MGAMRPAKDCASDVVRLTACARTTPTPTCVSAGWGPPAGLLACSGRLPDCVVCDEVPAFRDAGQEACGPRVHLSPDRSRMSEVLPALTDPETPSRRPFRKPRSESRRP